MATGQHLELSTLHHLATLFVRVKFYFVHPPLYIAKKNFDILHYKIKHTSRYLAENSRGIKALVLKILILIHLCRKTFEMHVDTCRMLCLA
jgi:hypothetical protein